MADLFGKPIRFVDKAPTGNTDGIKEIRLIDPAEYIGGAQCEFVGGPLDGEVYICRKTTQEYKLPLLAKHIEKGKRIGQSMDNLEYARYARVDENRFSFVGYE